MGKSKEEVRRMLDELSDEGSFEDISNHIYVRQKIERGLQAADRGDLIDQ